MVSNNNNQLALERRAILIERGLKKRMELTKNCNDEIRMKIRIMGLSDNNRSVANSGEGNFFYASLCTALGKEEKMND